MFDITRAPSFIGIYYYKGQNSYEAVKWYHKAAEQENVVAQRFLGMYSTFVKQNHTEAVKWYEKAAAQGDEAAKIVLRK